MRSTSSTAILEIIQNKLIARNCRTEVRLYVEKDSAWVLNHDIDWKVGIDWSESGKNQKTGFPALTPLASEISFQVYNENGKYSTGSGTAFEDYFDNNVRVKLQAGYNIGENLAESSQSLNLNDIAGSIIYSYFFNTEHSTGTVVIDPDSGITPVHFSDLFDPLYDSETYDDSFYTPDAYTVQTYDTTVPGYEQFNKFSVTANNAVGKIYYRTFDDLDEVDDSVSGQWIYAGLTSNGTETIDFDDITDERFLQIAVLYDGIEWGDNLIISDITVYYQSSIEWVYESVYYLDTPEFDDPPAPQMPMIFCSGRDVWKRAIETDINIADYSGATISPTNFIKAIADRCEIQYNATSIDTVTGFVNVNWAAGFTEPKKGNDAFELIMQKINPTGYQMYLKYDETIDDNILYVTEKPDTLIADGVFSYKNYNSVGNSRKNNDKTLQRFTVFTDQQTVDAEEQLDQESINSTGTTVFAWAGAVEAIYIRFEVDLPDNITATVTLTRTGASLVVTAITGTVVVTAYGCQWNAAPTFEGESINFLNQIRGIGSTYTSINPLMTSDAECASMAVSVIASFSTPVYEAQALMWPYINLLPEINDVYMLWRRFIFRDNLYYITKASHHWDRAEDPSESTNFDFDDSGRNFSESGDFIWDDFMDWDRGYVWDMGISTPISTNAEIDAATIIVHNVDCA